MNVFVLCTGRCGSTTFIRACQHMTNFTAGHESHTGWIGEDRLAYPPNHIEADHHLWFQLGRLDQEFGDGAYYVHLTRDPAKTADSWAQRFTAGPTIAAFRRGFIGSEGVSRRDAAVELVEVATANIEHFLKDKSRVLEVRLEHGVDDFRTFWSWIGAEGSLEDALAEWRVRHNEGIPRQPFLTRWTDTARRAFRAAVPYP